MRILHIIISFQTLLLVYSLTPQPITTEDFQFIMTDSNNVHYFVINSDLVTQHMVEHFEHYAGHETIKLYQCEPNDGLPHCSTEVGLYLVMNTIKIEFNGHEAHPEDLKKWIQYRINEHPDRLRSVKEVKEEAREKFEVFCYIDREGEEITKKERIFLAVAKTMHYLHFCYLDSKVGRKLKLKQGNMVLIKRNMNTTIDWLSAEVSENQTALLYKTWINFLIKSFANDFRIEGRDHDDHQILLECDMSLECEDELSSLLLWERVWRDQHPDLNFAINIRSSKTGQGTLSDNSHYDYPGFRYVTRTVTVRYIRQKGGVVKHTRIESEEELSTTPIHICKDSVETLLRMKEENKLKKSRSTSKVNLEFVPSDEEHKYADLIEQEPQDKLNQDL